MKPIRTGEPRSAVIALAAVWTLFAAAPLRAEWQSYRGSRDGLADGQVLALLEDRTGSLWFGTPRGPSRFDGFRWLSPDLGTANPVVQAITETEDQFLWFGIQGGGAVQFREATRERRIFSVASGHLPSDNVQAILEDHAGDLWFGTPNGLVRREAAGGQWTTFQPESGGLVHPNAWRLLEDSQRFLWVATPEGVGRLAPDRLSWESFRADPDGLGRDSVLAMAEDLSGGIWFGTDQGAWRWRLVAGVPEWKHFQEADGLRNTTVLAIHVDEVGGVWFGGTRGIDHFDGRTWRTYSTTTDGLPLGRVFSLLVDRSRNLWVGTESNGLFRYDRVDIQGFIAPEGFSDCSPRPALGGRIQPILASNCVQGLVEDQFGEIWAATSDRGAARLDRSGRWTFLRRAAGRSLSDSLSSVFLDSGGRLWFGSGNVSGFGRYAGVSILESDRVTWTAWRGPGVLPDDNVLSLHEDRAGTAWVGTAAGVAARSGGTWRPFLSRSVVGYDVQVYAIQEDSTGGIWLRTSDGLFRMAPGASGPVALGPADGLWTTDVRALFPAPGGEVWIAAAGGFGVWRDGVVTRSPLTTEDAEAIYRTMSGDIWVGLSNGALRLPSSGAHELHAGDVLGSTPVTRIFGDRSGTVWVATFGGLARFNGVGWNRFTTSDGLVSDQISHFLEDVRGRLWFGSFSGISQYDPDETAPQTVFVSTPPAISATRNVRFVFAAGYGEVADVEYRSALDSQSSNWTPNVTTEFFGLADGRHLFEVEARDWSRNADPTPARLEFEVDATPPPAVISAPAFGQAVQGAQVVRGTASDPRFRHYRLELRPAEHSSWDGPSVTRLDEGSEPIELGPLADWDTQKFPDGNYEMRLVVEDTLGLTGIAQLSLVVDNEAPFANVTTPVRIAAFTGGDVYTTGGEVHLYFPPRAFSLDAVVTIQPAPESGGPAEGAAPVVAWDIDWGNPRLEKAGVVELSPGSPVTEPLTLHRSIDQGLSWSRLGGSPAGSGGSIVGIIDQPGRYALFPEGSPPDGGSEFSRPIVIPRVFTPDGGSPGQVAISFTLGRSAEATVRVFNRAGRMVRELAHQVPMTSGINLLRWDGRDDDGTVVTDGLYFVRVESGDESRTQTLVVRR
ncbi:MAG: two-component regulator propeller domain-containing protein [Candidatus Eisenbacteria bacterium]|nr:two-component regulator propeller domain-containing protein [Candidatus Eisenbacteria bacterium]